ncbi:hypothetical protein [Gordonia sp. CPCC 205333]|uniref:hypothetical protein n=1 Tax=Gordonia sp. CPCC 205333 TaxID=3140790 RepID=UPI003AF3D41E
MSETGPGKSAPDPASIVDMSWLRARQVALSPESPELPRYSISARPASVGGTDWTPPWYDDDWFRPSGACSEFVTRIPSIDNESVRGLVTLNPSRVLALDRAVAQRAEWLLSRIAERGSVSSDYFRTLEAAASSGAGLSLRELWPNLTLLVAWNSASAGLYRAAIKRLLPNVNRLPFSTTGTEGIVTIPVDSHQSAGPLAVDQGFYEFISWEDMNDGAKLPSYPATLLADELVDGAIYRLVMSQGNGLLRYDVGDLYKVVGHVGGTPRLEFIGRAGAGHSFTGEKLTENQVYDAVRSALQAELPADSATIFTVSPVWADPPLYTAIIESAAGTDTSEVIERIAARIDRELMRQNLEYGEKRASHRLGRPRVLLVPSGTLSAAAGAIARPGTSSAQIKHFWIQRDSKLLARVEATVGARGGQR